MAIAPFKVVPTEDPILTAVQRNLSQLSTQLSGLPDTTQGLANALLSGVVVKGLKFPAAGVDVAVKHNLSRSPIGWFCCGQLMPLIATFGESTTPNPSRSSVLLLRSSVPSTSASFLVF